MEISGKVNIISSDFNMASVTFITCQRYYHKLTVDYVMAMVRLSNVGFEKKERIDITCCDVLCIQNIIE